MKHIFPLLLLSALSFLNNTAAADDPAGYLVIEVGRYTYVEGKKGGEEIKQSFKIPLTDEFMANFKNRPNINSMGTGLCCSGGSLKAGNGSTAFIWWIHRMNPDDGRWYINMWGEGVETVGGAAIESRSRVVTQVVKIKKWEDIDMAYQVSYVHGGDGMNVGFTARYVSAEDHKTLDAIPTAPVKKANGKLLIKGDDLSKLPMEIHCLFQEG